MTETDFKPLPKKLVELTQYYTDKIYRLSGYDPLTESKGKYITRRRVILACKLLEKGYKKTTVGRAMGINRSRIGLYEKMLPDVLALKRCKELWEGLDNPDK